jgi:hypothetical protein
MSIKLTTLADSVVAGASPAEVQAAGKTLAAEFSGDNLQKLVESAPVSNQSGESVLGGRGCCAGSCTPGIHDWLQRPACIRHACIHQRPGCAC